MFPAVAEPSASAMPATRVTVTDGAGSGPSSTPTRPHLPTPLMRRQRYWRDRRQRPQIRLAAGPVRGVHATGARRAAPAGGSPDPRRLLAGEVQPAARGRPRARPGRARRHGPRRSRPAQSDHAAAEAAPACSGRCASVRRTIRSRSLPSAIAQSRTSSSVTSAGPERASAEPRLRRPLVARSCGQRRLGQRGHPGERRKWRSTRPCGRS